jgi:hypothetical protein
VNGNECTKPGKIHHSMLVASNATPQVIGQSSTVTGYCSETLAGPIGAAPVVIGVKVEANGSANCVTGGSNTGVLEVEEIQP